MQIDWFKLLKEDFDMPPGDNLNIDSEIDEATQIPEPGNMIRTKKMQMEGRCERVEQNKGGSYDVYFRIADGRLMRAPLSNVIVIEKLEDGDDEELNEISNELLAKYKTAAGKSSSEADKRGDYATGHKRFKGITQATKKQFAQDQKKRVAERQDNEQDLEIHDYDKLDGVLLELCELVEKGQSSPKDYGMVAAAIIDPDNNVMARLNRPGMDGKRIHAERAVIEAYLEKHGGIPEGSIILTTLSPCNEHMDERDGPSCTETINDSGVKKVYCGYMDPTQDNDVRLFNVMETVNKDIREKCKQFADTFLDTVHENFADGKKPGRKGLAKRSGVNTKASVSDLRKTAKHSTGEKARMAHWLANMKAGKAKKK